MFRHTILESVSVYLVFLIGTFSRSMNGYYFSCPVHFMIFWGVGSDTSCFLCILHYQRTPLLIMPMPHYRETPLKVVVSETITSWLLMYLKLCQMSQLYSFVPGSWRLFGILPHFQKIPISFSMNIKFLGRGYEIINIKYKCQGGLD